jgi:hypothetical protein
MIGEYLIGLFITIAWAKLYNIWPRRSKFEVMVIYLTWPIGWVYCGVMLFSNLFALPWDEFTDLKFGCKFGIHDLYTEDSGWCIYHHYKCKYCFYTKSVSYDGF